MFDIKNRFSDLRVFCFYAGNGIYMYFRSEQDSRGGPLRRIARDNRLRQ
jgi:hypothetical protein